MEVTGDGLGLAFGGSCWSAVLGCQPQIPVLGMELRLGVTDIWRGRVATDKEPGNLTKTDKAGCQTVVETV